MDTWLGNCMAVSASRNGFDHAASEVKMRGIRVPRSAARAGRRTARTALRGLSRVAMVQAADVRNDNHGTSVWRLHVSRRRCIAVQRQMGAGIVVIIEIRGEKAFEMSVAHDDHMIEALAADGADEAFDVGILPGTARSRHDFFDAEAVDALSERVAVDAVAVVQEKAWRGGEGKSLHELLCRPDGSRMLGHVEV